MVNFFLFMLEMGFCLCVYVPKFGTFECWCVGVRAVGRAIMNTYICAYNGVHLYIFTYFCCLWVGRGETKEESVRREEWVRRGKRNCYSHNDFFFSLSYSTF